MTQPSFSSDSSPIISIVVMAFNERENLGVVALEIHSELTKQARPFELIILDDGSTDGTGALADQLTASLKNTRVIHHATNEGLGGVYRHGFESAQGRYLSFFPADGQFPASIIPDFLAAIDDHDMVLGYIETIRRSFGSRVLSRVERLMYRIWIGRMPRFQGVFLIRRDILAKIRLRSTGRGWAILMELILIVSRSGYKVTHRCTPYRPRLSGHSKVNNLRTIFANTRQILGLRRLLKK